MAFLIYPFAVVAALAVDIVCRFFLNWIVAACADEEGNLPRFLSWFQTFDATLDEGMHARRREVQANLGGQDWADFNPYPWTWFDRYKNRALWLFRNSAYGFDYYVFGLRWDPAEWRVIRYFDRDDLTLFIALGRGFNVYYHGRWGMVKLGWKAWNTFDGAGFSRQFGDGTCIPIVFSLSPFKRKTP